MLRGQSLVSADPTWRSYLSSIYLSTQTRRSWCVAALLLLAAAGVKALVAGCWALIDKSVRKSGGRI